MLDLSLLEYAAIGFFAVTGALMAAEKEMDIFGFILLGTVTGIGGGTIRDLLLGDVPIFWVKDPIFIIVCASVSTLVFFAREMPEQRLKLLLWLDAAGLAVFAIRGAHKALAMGTGPTVAIIMGVITATFGGIIRDILGNEIPLILRREIYVTAAFIGVLVYLAGLYTLPPAVAAGLGMIVALLVRVLAIQFHWSLPTYKAKI